MTPLSRLQWLRDWRGAAVATLLLILFYAVAVSFISPNVFIAKLHVDSLIYFIQAQYLAHHGTLSGLMLGEGIGPIVFAPVAGYVRAPLFIAFDRLDTIIRAIQVQNIVILALVGLLSWKYLRLRLPQEFSRLWCLVPFGWLCTRYMPWFNNAFTSSSDHIFAALQLSFIVLSLHHKYWLKTIARAIVFSLLLLALFVVAAIQKFTAIPLLAYLAVLLLEEYKLSRQQVAAAAAGAAVTIATLVVTFRTLYAGYLVSGISHNLAGRSFTANLVDMVVNFLVVALPAQIWPNFRYLFPTGADPTLPPLETNLHVHVIPWMIIGLVTSAFILRGAWLSRRRMAPELVFLLLTVPVYAAVTRSEGTARYLASMQPFFLVFFLVGVRPTWMRLRERLGSMLPKAAILAVLLIGASTIAGLSGSVMSKPLGDLYELPGFFAQLDRDFAAARIRIDALAGPRTRFVGLVGGEARWYPVAGIHYIAPEVTVTMLCRGYKVYAVTACDRRTCGYILHDANITLGRLQSEWPIEIKAIDEIHSSASNIVIRQLNLSNARKHC